MNVRKYRSCAAAAVICYGGIRSKVYVQFKGICQKEAKWTHMNHAGDNGRKGLNGFLGKLLKALGSFSQPWWRQTQGFSLSVAEGEDFFCGNRPHLPYATI